MTSKRLVLLITLFAFTQANAATLSLQHGLSVLTLLGFFGIGILLAFTPCVLPMVPILSAILIGQREAGTRRAFGLSLVFVLSMAVTYAAAGIVAGYLGSTLQTLMQTPFIIVGFSLIFVLMALSMFGWFDFTLPSFLQTRLHHTNNHLKRGSFFGVALMGVLSTLIASPCITAPLLSVLTYISQTGNAGQGGLILFVMALGMGVPLLLFGIGQSTLLPKTGAWMEKVKHVFGVLILGLAIWMSSRILPIEVTMLLSSALLIISSVAFGALDLQSRRTLPVLHGANVLAFICGVLVLIGAASGHNNIWMPLQPTFSQGVLNARPASALFAYAQTMENLQEKLLAAKKAQKPVLIEFSASWCPDCQKVDKEVLSDPEVRKEMRALRAIRVDVSERNPALAKMMEAYHIYGVPTMVFYDRNGKLFVADKLNGDITRDNLLATLQQLNS